MVTFMPPSSPVVIKDLKTGKIHGTYDSIAKAEQAFAKIKARKIKNLFDSSVTDPKVLEKLEQTLRCFHYNDLVIERVHLSNLDFELVNDETQEVIGEYPSRFEAEKAKYNLVSEKLSQCRNSFKFEEISNSLDLLNSQKQFEQLSKKLSKVLNTQYSIREKSKDDSELKDIPLPELDLSDTEELAEATSYRGNKKYQKSELESVTQPEEESLVPETEFPKHVLYLILVTLGFIIGLALGQV